MSRSQIFIAFILLIFGNTSFAQSVERQNNIPSGYYNLGISVSSVSSGFSVNQSNFNYHFTDDSQHYIFEGEGKVPTGSLFTGFEIGINNYFYQRYVLNLWGRIQYTFSKDDIMRADVALGWGYLFYLKYDRVQDMPRSWLEVGLNYTFGEITQTLHKHKLSESDPYMIYNGKDVKSRNYDLEEYRLQSALVRQTLMPYMQVNHFVGKNTVLFAKVTMDIVTAEKFIGRIEMLDEEGGTNSENIFPQELGLSSDGVPVNEFVLRPGMASFSVGVIFVL